MTSIQEAGKRSLYTGAEIPMLGDPEAEWAATVSGRLLTELNRMAVRDGQPMPIVRNPGDPIQDIFEWGKEKEKAHLLKLTHPHEGGQSSLVNGIESYEYRHYPWWREAILELQRQGVKIALLDTQVVQAAADAGVEDRDRIFRPREVVAHYGWLGNTREETEDMVSRVREVILDNVGLVIPPDYRVGYQAGGIRLLAQSVAGEESRYEENDTYRLAVDGIGRVAHVLELQYDNMNRARKTA